MVGYGRDERGNVVWGLGLVFSLLFSVVMFCIENW